MIPDGAYLGVLDRFEGELAVLVLERGGEAVDDLVVDRTRLPREGRHQDAVFRVELVDGEPTRLEYWPGLTRKRRRDAQRRFDRLARRPPREGAASGGANRDSGRPDEETSDDESARE